MRTPALLVVFSVTCLFVVIIYLFWLQDAQYSVPTKKPVGFEQIPIGSLAPVSFNQKEKKPTLMHFFNPDCPCSKFNFEHFSNLYRKYHEQMNFIVVLQSDDSLKAKSSFSKYGIEVRSITDVDGKIADSFGVYSTPQAVLIDKNNKICYRGNYNKSRYCVNRNTAFVSIAIDSVLSNAPVPAFVDYAYKAYGCQLPSDVVKQTSFIY